MLNSTPTKILMLGSNPVDMDQLATTAEFMAIDEKLVASGLRGEFELYSAWDVRAAALPGLIARYSPDILHFGGHGNEAGQLLFQGSRRNSHAPDLSVIADVFHLAGDTVRCALLNACHSAVQAKAIANYIEIAIGMRGAIEDESAISFAAGFYESLGHGKSAAVAFEWAKAVMKLAGSPDGNVPVMFAGPEVDASRVFLRRSSGERPAGLEARPTDAQLQDFIASAFSISELQRFLTFEVDGKLASDVSFSGSIAEVVFSVIKALRSRGLVNDALRISLLKVRPGRKSEILGLFSDD